MYMCSSDEEPLLPQHRFVRQGAFRVSTRRPQRPTFVPRVSPDIRQSNTTAVFDIANANSIRIAEIEIDRDPSRPQVPETSRVNCLPPLPPQRHYDESLQKSIHEGSRKAHSFNHRGDHVAPGALNCRPHSPSPVQPDFRKNSQSFNSGRQTPSPRASSIFNGDFVNHYNQENDSISREQPSQRPFSPMHRSPSPSFPRKKSPSPSNDGSKQMQNFHPSGSESKKGIPSFFRRSPSPIFHRSLTPPEERSNSFKGLRSLSVDGRPSAPTFTHQAQPLPRSYQRDRNVSDHTTDGVFKRHGSFPLQRKHLRLINPYGSPSRNKEPEGDQIRASVTFRRPSTPTLESSQPIDTSLAGQSRSGTRKDEAADCFALLPSSRLGHPRETKTYDPEMVNLPIQNNPSYEKIVHRRIRRISDCTCPSSAELVVDDRERPDLLIKLRTHSLPPNRRVRNSSPPCTATEQETRGERSSSLNSQIYETNKVQQPQGENGGCRTSPTSSEEETIDSPLFRSSGSLRSRESMISYISDGTVGDPMDFAFSDHLRTHKHLARRISSCSSSSTGSDLLLCEYNAFDNQEEQPVERQSNSDHISYLLNNDEEYLICLGNMLKIYEKMCKDTPSHIRQHFDVLFRHIDVLHQFHKELHTTLKEVQSDLLALADVFQDEQFQCYKPYMIMSPVVQKGFHKYSTYFNEHFPSLKTDFLKPSVRINFYAMLLESLKKSASEYEKIKLQSSIDYLFTLKRQANTEMTIGSVFNSPVDLRLCGDLLITGDLFCYGTGPLQKRKYHMILFESILLITSSKLSSFKYKIHFRVEQLEEVKEVESDDCEFTLRVLTEGQLTYMTFRFKVRSHPQRDQWITNLQKIIRRNKLQYPCERFRSVLRNSTCQMLPLSLYKVYPQLLHAMTENEELNPHSRLVSPQNLCYQLLSQERCYIKQIASLLNPDTMSPPESICSLLGKLHNFHARTIFPELERAQQMDIEAVLICINDHIHSFHIYLDYFVVRCQLNFEIERKMEASLYISPVQHFTYYMQWLKDVKQISSCKGKAMEILQRLKDLVLEAQVRLLSESIVSGRIDFYRSGNLLRNDQMEVRTRKKGVHEGMYNVLLFEKIIILTKPRPPQLEYVWDIWLNQVNLGPPSNSERGFKLEVRQGRGKEAVTFEFRAQSPTIQRIWIQNLQKELIHQAENIRNRICLHSLKV